MIPRPTNKELEGMTVNERLFACGLLDRYLESERKRSREEMVSLLSQVAFTREQACEITDKILAEPKRFGF